jgi:hypothetical protein
MGVITNIKSLNGMGIYADRSPRSPSLQFRRYNLVYGFNGSGKSTLSRLFASLEAGEAHPKLPEGGAFEFTLEDDTAFGCPTRPTGLERRVLVFNSDYIERNLQWAAGRANPVFYIGADQAEAAAELTKIEGEIRRAAGSVGPGRPCPGRGRDDPARSGDRAQADGRDLSGYVRASGEVSGGVNGVSAAHWPPIRRASAASVTSSTGTVSVAPTRK